MSFFENKENQSSIGEVHFQVRKDVCGNGNNPDSRK
jgi:hypothetical protein